MLLKLNLNPIIKIWTSFIIKTKLITHVGACIANTRTILLKILIDYFFAFVLRDLMPGSKGVVMSHQILFILTPIHFMNIEKHFFLWFYVSKIMKSNKRKPFNWFWLSFYLRFVSKLWDYPNAKTISVMKQNDNFKIGFVTSWRKQTQFNP